MSSKAEMLSEEQLQEIERACTGADLEAFTCVVRPSIVAGILHCPPVVETPLNIQPVRLSGPAEARDGDCRYQVPARASGL
jgi:hypothetical protein